MAISAERGYWYGGVGGKRIEGICRGRYDLLGLGVLADLDSVAGEFIGPNNRAV